MKKPDHRFDPNRLPARAEGPFGAALPTLFSNIVEIDEKMYEYAPRRNESAEKIRAKLAKRIFGRKC